MLWIIASGWVHWGFSDKVMWASERSVPPFSVYSVFRDPDDNPSDQCPQCGPCPVGCGGNGSENCSLSHAYWDCWPGTCQLVCVYSCSACGARGGDNTIPHSYNPSPRLSVYVYSPENRDTTPKPGTKIAIYDVNGRKVWNGTWRGNLPKLPSGVYIVRSIDGRYVKRIIVR